MGAARRRSRAGSASAVARTPRLALREAPERSAAASQLRSAFFAEARVGVVDSAALATRWRRGWRGRRPLCLFRSLEILHQRQRTGAKAGVEPGEVRLRDLPHRAIELEFLDRPQHECFLALECFRRSRAARRLVRVTEAPKA